MHVPGTAHRRRGPRFNSAGKADNDRIFIDLGIIFDPFFRAPRSLLIRGCVAAAISAAAEEQRKK